MTYRFGWFDAIVNTVIAAIIAVASGALWRLIEGHWSSWRWFLLWFCCGWAGAITSDILRYRRLSR